MSIREIDVRKSRNGWWQVREVGVHVVAASRSEVAARTVAADFTHAAEVLDRTMPKRGPCLICGIPGEDQTHRSIDAIADRFRAGDHETDIADDYGVAVETVAACLTWTQSAAAARRTHPTTEETA